MLWFVFKSIGVFDYMNSKEFLEETADYIHSHDTEEELKYIPFRSRLEREHGKEASMIYWKYGFLANGFDTRFGRIYKHYSAGMDVFAAFEKIKLGEKFIFSTTDPTDISALIKLNDNWIISVDDMEPCNSCYKLEMANDIKINPQTVLVNPKRVGLEFYALKMINRAIYSQFVKQDIDEEILQAVYELILSGKHINSTEIMRLAMLWLWDKAHENADRPESFDAVYPLLQKEIDSAGLTDNAWDQIMNRRKRVAGYYAVTDYCIKKHTITSLNYSLS